MGYGDEIMAAGHAMAKSRQLGEPVAILGPGGRVRWSDVWLNNPFILEPERAYDYGFSPRRPEQNLKRLDQVVNGPAARPYVRYPFTIEAGQRFTSWRCRDYPGALYFTEPEHAIIDAERLPDEFVVIEPHIGRHGNPNKDWGFDNYIEVARLLRNSIEVIQVGEPGTKALPNARFVHTNTFRLGALVVSRAKLYVGAEGGLHHSAAVSDVRGVVLFGGAPSVNATGYGRHTNVVPVNHQACGNWAVKCPECQGFWCSLKPQLIADLAEQLL